MTYTITNNETAIVHDTIEDMLQGLEWDSKDCLYIKGNEVLTSGEGEPPSDKGWKIVEFTALENGYKIDNIEAI